MTDLRRFFEDEPDGSASQLLGSALSDAPPPGALPKVAAVLGVSAATLGATAGASAAGGALAAGASGGAVASKLGSAGLAGLTVQWLALGALGGAVVVGGAELTRPAAPLPAAAMPSASASDPAPQRARVVRTEPALGVASPVEPPLASAAPRGALAGPAPSAAAAATGSGPGAGVEPAIGRFPGAPSSASLAAELADIDRARRALAQGDAAASLAALDAYDRAPGVLRPEAVVLRAEALVRAGRTEEARALARRELASAPRGPQAARLRAIAGAP